MASELYNVIVKVPPDQTRSGDGFLKFRKLSKWDLIKIQTYLGTQGIQWQYINVYRRNSDKTTQYLKRIYP
jgi:hypothetical protein